MYMYTYTMSYLLIQVSLEGNQDKVANAFSASDMKSILNKRLHRYLHYNAYHLPMYAQPDMI